MRPDGIKERESNNEWWAGPAIITYNRIAINSYKYFDIPKPYGNHDEEAKKTKYH